MRPPIGQTSICFMSLLFTENTYSLVNFNSSFLNIDFLQKGYEHKDEAMHPRSNQPFLFFATAETHKFESIDDISLESLKLRPIID